jgi:hypothetical protein
VVRFCRSPLWSGVVAVVVKPPPGCPLVWLSDFGQAAVAPVVFYGRAVGLLTEAAGHYPFIARVDWNFTPDKEAVLYLVEAPAPVEFFHEASILKLFHVQPRSFFFYSPMKMEFHNV